MTGAMTGAMTANLPQAKQTAFAWLDRNREAVAALGDAIFAFGEPGLEEHETVALRLSFCSAQPSVKCLLWLTHE